MSYKYYVSEFLLILRDSHWFKFREYMFQFDQAILAVLKTSPIRNRLLKHQLVLFRTVPPYKTDSIYRIGCAAPPPLPVPLSCKPLFFLGGLCYNTQQTVGALSMELWTTSHFFNDKTLSDRCFAIKHHTFAKDHFLNFKLTFSATRFVIEG